MIIISAVFLLVLSISKNSSNHIEDTFNTADIGDLMLWYKHGTLTSDEIGKIKNLNEIDKMDITTAVYTQEKNNVYINGQQAGLYFQFQVYNQNKHKYNVFNKSLTGYKSNAADLKEGEIYLPISLASKYHCKAGDNVEIKTTVLSLTLTIKGFVEEPTMGNPLIGGYKNVFISQADYDSIYKFANSNEFLATDIVQVYCSDNANLSGNELSVLLNNTANIVEKANTTVSLDEFKSYSRIITNIFMGVLMVFGALLFAVVLIVMGHSITTSIEMDYKNLGILKSQGYSGMNLKAVYILQYFGTILVGCVIGIVLGTLGVEMLNRVFVQITGLLIGGSVAALESAIALLAICLIIVVFIFIKTSRIGRIRPLDAIIETREVRKIRARVRFTIDKSLLSFKMAFRQITTNMKQYISSFTIVVLLVFFIMSIEMILTCFEAGNILEQFYGFTFDIEVNYKNNIDNREEVEKIIKGDSPITSTSEFYSASYTVNGSSVLGNAVDSSERFTNIYKGSAPSNETEVAITEVFAKAYDVKIGDNLDVTLNGNTKSYVITGYYQSVSKAGMQFSMLTSGLKRLDPSIEITTYDYKLADNGKASEIATKLKDQFGNEIEVTTLTDVLGTVNTITSLSKVIVIFVYSISVIFIIVAANMICGKIFLMELRDYGIYKSLGFSSQNLRAQFSIRFGILAVLGSGIGVLLSTMLNKQLIGAILRTLGITNFNANYTVFSIIGPILIMSITMSLSSYILSRKIKNVSTKMLISE